MSRQNVEGDDGSYSGPDGMRQFATDAAAEWEYLRIVPDEFRDLGDQVLLLGRLRAYSDPAEALDALER